MKKNLLTTTLYLFLAGVCSAQSGTYSGGGDGSSLEQAIEIATAADLIELSNNRDDCNLYFKQTADIVFNEDYTLVDWNGDGVVDSGDYDGFLPIATYNHGFGGKYFGQGYSIVNLFIERYESHAALFRRIDDDKDSEGENEELASIKRIDDVKAVIEGDLIILTTNTTGIHETYIYATDTYSLVRSNTFKLTIGREINASVNETDSLEENITQYDAEIGKTVKWTKTIKLNNNTNETIVKLPEQARNIIKRFWLYSSG